MFWGDEAVCKKAAYLLAGWYWGGGALRFSCSPMFFMVSIFWQEKERLRSRLISLSTQDHPSSAKGLISIFPNAIETYWLKYGWLKHLEG